ncbi:MAG: DUF805 domain-containing protein [Candidatus Riflebacteria bacterium]|nr:DUF805 domain-containing protein [Candidatus Riflebacteria bacterium]
MDFDYIKAYLSDFDQIKENFIEVAKECNKFDGKLNRTKFWTYALGISLVCFIINSIISIIFRGAMVGNIITGIIGIASFVIQVGPIMRRLRDAGKNPLLVLCIFPGCFLCCIPPFVPLVFCFYKSEGEETPTTTVSTTATTAEHPAQADQPAQAAPTEQPTQPQDQPPTGN